ncbi:zinc-binding alcohol dehydrogenase family protein [Brachybacterium sp. DNPG3]
MKSIRVTAPGRIELVEVTRPVPRPGEALLRVLYAGVCGSDLQTIRGTQPFASYPRVPGHEFSARIEEIVPADGGSDEADGADGSGGGLAVGDVVTGVPYFQDGTCSACRRGLINACIANETMGVHRDGAFQEYVTMPLERLHTSRGVDPRDLALVEPFSIGYHAMLRARVGAGDRVLVLGAGAIGQLTMLAAISRGAEAWIADVVPSRLERAAALGARGTVDLTRGSIAAVVEEATGGDGFDVVAEATGRPVSFLNAIEASAQGARIALIGNGVQEVTLNQSVLIRKELDVLGSRNSRGVFPQLVELIASGRTDVSPLRTRIVPLESATGALEEISSGAPGTSDDLKVLLDFSAGA